MKKTLIIISIAALLTSCLPANEFFFTEYKVLKGTHYATPQAAQPPLPRNWVTFQFKTNDTWDFERIGDFASKIGGIYWLYPHQCSVRICLYTNKEGGEELWYYIYDVSSGKKPIGKIMDCELNKTYEVSLGLKSGYWFVYIEGNEIEIPTDFKYGGEPRGFDSPYFGGEPTAPHTWIVPIKMVI